jgi:integrase
MAHAFLTTSLTETFEPESAQVEIYDRGHYAGGSFGIRIGRGGSRVFFVIYRLHGKRKRLTLGRLPLLTLTQAREQAREILAAVAEGRDPAAEKRSYRCSESFRELVSLFRKKKLETLSAKTMAEYQRIIQHEFMPLWSDRKLADLKRIDVKSLVQGIERRGSQVMAARALAVARSIFAFAVDEMVIDHNPAAEIAVELAVPQVNVLALGDLQAIWRASTLLSAVEGTALQMLLLSAQHPGDVLALRWGEVRFDVWEVARGKGAHEVYLVPATLKSLSELHKHRHGEYVFSQKSGKPFLSFTPILRSLQKLVPNLPKCSALDIYRSAKINLRRLGVRAEVIELLQFRRSMIARLGVEAEEQRDALRSVLLIWARALIPDEERREKVRSIFDR